MDKHQLLGAMGVRKLEDLTLKELDNKLRRAGTHNVPRKVALQILTEWLCEYTKKDIHGSLSDFVDLLLEGTKLKLKPFREIEVVRCLKEWQLGNHTDYMANQRRYLMVERDLKRLFEEAKPRLNPPKSSIKKKKGKGANIIPLGQRGTGSGAEPKATKVGNESSRANRGQDNVDGKSIVPIEEAECAVIRDPPETEPAPSLGNVNIPPKGYVCRICNQPGKPSERVDE
ncbi:hypothetical protein GGS23DRAFT_21037 [Durotheca rogersii]|uniref:uncharacterized protein n=1 Tax=Durotheca rogersii TaxID=419775 RepID=UPI00221F51C5|nr:uncharacterized protein GGS23DRAFT_21037 [Durotheca rogersii]KAI5868300.1 hypothetical protein GGS23DRAFT_21037 [Durotheca rogersii]